MDEMALVWDSTTKNYFLVGYQIQGREVRFVDRNINGKLWRYNLGRDPRKER